jgi:Ca-activated chloride channel family protein
MRWAQANFILGFLVFCSVILFYYWADKSRKAVLEKFAHKDLLNDLLIYVDFRRKRLKAIIIILSLALSIFALFRPQWGFHWQEVKRKGLDIIVALDTSKSMRAEDIKPSRIARAKLALGDLAKNLKGDRIGLIAFAGSAFLQCPLTVDYGGFLLTLDNTDTDIIPKGGTSITSAIKEAVKSYEGGQKKYKVLVIITDGEDHQGDALKAAEEAKKEGIVIFCIGIGTKEGDLIPVKDESGRMTFLKDKEGNVVKSRLDETTLQKIALTTGGGYVRATNTEFGLELLYREKLSKMEKREFLGKMNKHYEERYQIFLSITLLLLAIEPFIRDSKAGNNMHASLFPGPRRARR